MQNAKLKQINTERGRRYEVTDTDGTTYLLPSVTTILGVIGKPALINWAAKTEREAVVHAATQLYLDAPLKPPMSEAAYRTSLLARLGKDKAHIKQMEKAAAIGSNVHEVIEWHLRRELGQKVLRCPELLPEAVPCFSAYQAWALEHELRPLLIEQTVWSKAGRYAGTMDVLAEATMDGKRVTVVLDWKTSSGIWKEYRLQIAAYAKAIHEMGHTKELPGGLIVRLPKAKKPGESTEPEFCYVPAEEHGPLLEAFMAARNLWAWIEGEE